MPQENSMVEINRVLVIMAHPDDAEFSCSGTVAKWVREGRQVSYVLCTSGDKGSTDPNADPLFLMETRESEQRAAAQVLGVQDIWFLRIPDGRVEDDLVLRERLVRIIRQWKPDIVMTHDPYRLYQLHRDHRNVGWAAMDAVFPSSRDPLNFPEQIREGLSVHKAAELYFFGSDNPDVWIDIAETIGLKLAALRCHVSQVGHLENLEDRIRDWAALSGKAKGIDLAEGFKRVELRR
jgi:LmbE family N-acetylglucosaminyl deacetylase